MVSALPDNGDARTQTSPDGEADAGAETESTTSTPAVPTLDVVFDVLRNSRRRHVLELLASQDGATTLGDLAEHIGGIENDKPPSELSSQERKRVYVGLYQSHLPKMADADAITYDDRGTVEPGPHFEAFYEYLDGSTPESSPLPTYTAGVVGACALAVAVTFLTSELVSAVIIAMMIGFVGVVGMRLAD